MGSGFDGVVRICDLGNGRLVNEFRAATNGYAEGIIHVVLFSLFDAELAVTGKGRFSDPEYFATFCYHNLQRPCYDYCAE